MGVSELMEQGIEDKERKIDQAKLTSLLQEAKKEHTKFEQETGSKDEDWADWYANFLAEKLDGEATKDELKSLLNQVAEKYTGKDWPEKYAGFILNELDKKDYR